MPSIAYQQWKNVNLVRLNELEHVHASATGQLPGRRWGTEQLNRSLFTALTGQFQAFCRELHDAAVEVHVDHANVNQKQLLRLLLTQGRKLDVGNPRKSTLGADFGRLGFSLVDDLAARGPSTVRRMDRLETLVDFRNAIGHGNESAISNLVQNGGIAPTKGSYRKYRSAVDSLAGTMDQVVAAKLSTLLGIGLPW
jgi:hypothetical protein